LKKKEVRSLSPNKKHKLKVKNVLIFILIPNINAIYVLMAAGIAGLVLPQSITIAQKTEGDKKS
jgi:hypothetical protein